MDEVAVLDVAGGWLAISVVALPALAQQSRPRPKR